MYKNFYIIMAVFLDNMQISYIYNYFSDCPNY